MRRTLTLGPLVLTTTTQGAGAPALDGATSVAADRSWTAGGWCLRIRPTEGRALIVALRGRPCPSIATVRRLRRLPILGRLFAFRGHLA